MSSQVITDVYKAVDNTKRQKKNQKKRDISVP